MVRDKNNPINWDIKSLKIFLLISRFGSLTKAGIELGIPQSAVSRYVTNLELKAGGHLFQRHGRGVYLTELGQRLLPIIERINEEFSVISQIISDESESPSGLVRIGTLPSLSKDVFVPLFFLLQKEYPNVHLKIQEGSGGQIDNWLSSHQIDIGVPYRNINDNEYTSASSLQLKSYLIGPIGDKLTENSTVDFKKLHQIPLILPSKPSAVRLKLDDLAKRENIALKIVIEADSGLMQKSITRQHGGYTVLPWHTVREEVENKQLQAARIINPEIDRNISIVINNNPSKATRTVGKLIQQILEKKPLHKSELS